MIISRLLLAVFLLLTVSIQPQQEAPRYNSLERFLGHARVLIIIDMQADDGPFSTQWGYLAAAVPALTDRNITVVPVLKIESVPLQPIPGLRTARLSDTGAAATRTRFKCSDPDFCLLLLDLDGNTLLSSGSAVHVSQLLRLIDAARRRPPPTSPLANQPPVQDASTFSTTPSPRQIESPSSFSTSSGASPQSEIHHGTIDAYNGQTRLLLVMDQQAGDSTFAAQWYELQQHVADLKQLNITIVPLLRVQSVAVPSIAMPTTQFSDAGAINARARFQCGDTDFCVGLVDLDGTTLLRAGGPVPASQLVETINATPERVREQQQAQRGPRP